MSSTFRVIIVGAGPTGLALGNMLVAAGIDFLILERYHTVVAESGACITLWPHSTRILAQLGFEDLVGKDVLKLHSRRIIDGQGNLLSDDPSFRWIEENHGYGCLHYPRSRLTKLLYDGLKENKSKIRTSAAIRNIETDDFEVRVHLQDGSVEKGSMVIGADGVKSQVRDFMQQNAAKDGIALDEEPQVTSFECLFGMASQIPGAAEGAFWESRGKNIATQFATTGRDTHFAIYRRLPKPVSVPRTFTEEDKSRYFDKTGDVSIATNVKVRDLRPHCVWARLVDQPEGILKRWYYGRMLVCGESAAQVTALAGMGYNAALQSGIFLVNGLRDLLNDSPDVSKTALDGLFQQYQAVRQVETQAVCEFSSSYIRGVTWSTWTAWLFVKFIAPIVWGEEGMIKKIGRDFISTGRKLNFVQWDEKSGSIPWKDNQAVH